MTVHGTGRIATVLRSALNLEGDCPVAGFDCVRDTDSVAAYAHLADSSDTGERFREVLSVAADGDMLLFLSGPIASNLPCPRCLLYHLSTSLEQASALRRGTEIQPSESTLQLVEDWTQKILSLRESRSNSRFVTVVDTHKNQQFSSHLPIAHPCCDHRSIRQWALVDAKCSTVEDLLSKVADPSLGVVRAVDSLDVEGRYRPLLAEAELVRCQFAVPAVDMYGKASRTTDLAVGVGQTADLAKTRAVMEGIERYCALAYRDPDFEGPRDALERPVVGPEQFYGYSENQYGCSGFPFDPVDDQTVTRWSVAASYPHGAKVVIPHECLTMTSRLGESRSLIKTNTSGVAAHFDVQDAIRNAVLELIERDAVMRRWYRGETLPKFENDSLPDNIRAYRDTITEVGHEVAVLDATRFDSFPCVIVVSLHDKIPAAVVTSSCHLTYTAAAAGAFRETIEGLLLAETLPDGLTTISDPESVESPADHFRFYADPGNQQYVRALVGRASRSFPQTEHPVGSFTDALANESIGVYVAELTPPGIRRTGAQVVRALSPDLVPVSFGYGMARLEHDDDPVDDNAVGPVHPLT